MDRLPFEPWGYTETELSECKTGKQAAREVREGEHSDQKGR